jgi:hypothetical protein
MATNAPRCIIPVLVSLLLCICGWPDAAAGQGSITAVQVMPNARGIIIRSDSSLGRHSTSVFQNPSRLAIDFETTKLGKVPARIRVNEGGIQEVRLGYSNSRARVVMDFGNGPVPKFKIEQGHSMMVVALDKSAPANNPDKITSAADEASPPPEAFRAPAATPHPARSPVPGHAVVAQGSVSPKQVNSSAAVVKTSGARDNHVFVELADRKNPKRKCRVVIEIDPHSFNVQKVTLSDVEGNLRLFQAAEGEVSGGAPVVSHRAGTGPRRMPHVASSAPSPVKKRLQWGAPAAQPGKEPEPSFRGAPGRLQEFRLEHRRSVDDRY